jgi:hypothetical protein
MNSDVGGTLAEEKSGSWNIGTTTGETENCQDKMDPIS